MQIKRYLPKFIITNNNEAAAGDVLQGSKAVVKISQCSQGNNCVGVSFQEIEISLKSKQKNRKPKIQNLSDFFFFFYLF